MMFNDRLRAHLTILRVDHWFKNIFMLPGTVVAVSLMPSQALDELLFRLVAGFAALCLTASSYYTLNELLDAPYDAYHPEKKHRPVPSGRVNVPLAWLQWLVLGIVSMLAGWWLISWKFAAVQASLWLMGCIYNVSPIRTKDIAYLDVISESINNPLRMLAGWYVTTSTLLPPLSLLMAYWMVGGFFMTLKRYAEYRSIGDRQITILYRKSFQRYDERGLLNTVLFYTAASMICLGAFIVRYRLELILGFPLIALVMTMYFDIGMRPNSPVQAPEKLYREPGLMVVLVATLIVLVLLMLVDMPWLHRALTPQISTPL